MIALALMALLSLGTAQAVPQQPPSYDEAVRELSAGDPGARADLQRCRAQTPELG